MILSSGEKVSLYFLAQPRGEHAVWCVTIDIMDGIVALKEGQCEWLKCQKCCKVEICSRSLDSI